MPPAARNTLFLSGVAFISLGAVLIESCNRGVFHSRPEPPQPVTEWSGFKEPRFVETPKEINRFDDWGPIADLDVDDVRVAPNLAMSFTVTRYGRRVDEDAKFWNGREWVKMPVHADPIRSVSVFLTHHGEPADKFGEFVSLKVLVDGKRLGDILDSSSGWNLGLYSGHIRIEDFRFIASAQKVEMLFDEQVEFTLSPEHLKALRDMAAAIRVE